MEGVRDACTPEEYIELVNNKLTSRLILDYEHAKNMLLIAIGSLVTPSYRGSIQDIVTYNFDDLMEWYLDLHGFKVQIISSLPFLHQNADVHIYHPHGFLPKLSKYSRSKYFVFDSFSYDLTVGNRDFPFYKILIHLLQKKIAIMVGISGNDPALTSLVTNVNLEISNSGNRRPIAFLLNRKVSIESNPKDWYKKRGIVPLGFSDYDEIWAFLLKICQRSAQSI